MSVRPSSIHLYNIYNSALQYYNDHIFFSNFPRLYETFQKSKNKKSSISYITFKKIENFLIAKLYCSISNMKHYFKNKTVTIYLKIK